MLKKIIALALTALLTLAAVAWWNTEVTPKKVAAKKAVVVSAEFVDETTYSTAQRLADLAATPEEQSYIQSALRVSDHELALAFTAALRDIDAHPPKLSPDALKIQQLLLKSQALLDADQQRVTDLTAAIARAKSTERDELQDDLELAQSQLGLDKDEVEEANQALLDAGGDPQQSIETRLEEHAAQVKARQAEAVLKPTAATSAKGALGHFREWLALRQKVAELEDAVEAADEKVAALNARRTQLAAALDDTKGGIAELAQHSKAIITPPTAPVVKAPHSHEDAASLIHQTRAITADQKVLTVLERQTTDQRQLAGIYQQWSALVRQQAQTIAHALLLDALIVIMLLLSVILLDHWLQRLLNNPKLDRRQVETLRSLTRTAIRVIAALVILLIVIGVPGQFGTMIGIVGASLTVALKDFIVAFFGWLVLMGRNGIRLGDWVEINGVSGEVVELGMFHTVLLETGNWSDAGHPTGRRVTFTNSFAIEKHYFNFSTSGQWLWDELLLVVPPGQDPYPIVDAMNKLATEATAESARQAESEWQRSVPAQRGKSFTGTPGIGVKPVVGGIEISVRYITRANERFALRTQLYQAAVNLLGNSSVVQASIK